MDFTDLLLAVVMAIHVYVCPYTKVEESFNMQAIHDLMYHGYNISKYDHLEFPGVVPRSFLGPMAVTGLLYPFFLLKSYYLKYLNVDIHLKLYAQIEARLALGLLVMFALYKYKESVMLKFGRTVGLWMMIITTSQFHFMFYMSRPLPNIFALVLVLHAIGSWLVGSHAAFIWYSAFAIIIFRGELCLLLGLMLLMELWSRRLSFGKLLLHAIPAGVAALGLTVVVDSFLWQRRLWPEGEVLWYNTIENKSSDWGTSPFLWYFYSAIPRSLSATLPVVILGLLMDRRTRQLLFPCVAFVWLYSFLPHKELRFIIYIIPVCNTVAAVAINRVWQNKSKSFFRLVLALGAVSHILVNLTSTSGMAYISVHNYPGGEAIQTLHQMESQQNAVNVHLDVYACQTGISRFTQLHDNWRYDKTEDLKPGSPEMQRFTHLITKVPEEGADNPYKDTHTILSTISAFKKIRFKGYDAFPLVELVVEPVLVILKKITSN